MELPDSLSNLGEYALHKEIAARLNAASGARVVGDDAAVLSLDGSTDPLQLIISTDRLAAGVPDELRARLLVTQTFSDVICMGAKPLGMLLAVQVEREADPRVVVDLVEAVDRLCQQYGCHLVGGDTKEGDSFAAVGVGFGTAYASRVVRRVPITAGDMIGVTLAGRTKWGRRWANHLLNHFQLAVSDAERSVLAASDSEFTLPVAECEALIDSGVKAGLDLSDGVGASLGILSDANDVSFSILPESLDAVVDSVAVAPVARQLGLHPRAFALSPGYMWNVMYAVDPHRVDEACSAAQSVGGDFVIIAEAKAGRCEVLYGDGSSDAVAAASDEKFRKWAWADRTERWVDVMKDSVL
jgi:thiamine-monophosphate kinase